MKKLPVLCFSLLLVCASLDLYATHLRGGYITSENVSSNQLNIKFSIVIFKDSGAAAEAGSGDIDFGDGTVVNISELPSRVYFVPITDEVSMTVVEVEHSYLSTGSYIVSYVERNRNTGILNIDNSVETPFYLEHEIVLDPVFPDVDAPTLNNQPSFYAVSGKKFTYNPALIVSNGDSLQYELSTPLQSKGRAVDNYRFPNDPGFYPDFATGNEMNNDLPTIKVNPITGDLVWDAPGIEGEYVVTMKVSQWRKQGEVETIVSTMIIDIQIIVQDVDVDRPEIETPMNICYDPDETVNGAISISAVGDNSMKLSVYTDAENATFNGSTSEQFNDDDITVTGDQIINYTIEQEQDQPYHLVVFNVEQASDASARDYSWSTGFLVGFGCDTLGRRKESIITSIETDLRDPIGFSVYVKDRKGTLFIDSNSSIGDHFEIFSLTGKSLYRAPITTNVTDFLLDKSLGVGIYIARLRLQNGSFESVRFRVQ